MRSVWLTRFKGMVLAGFCVSVIAFGGCGGDGGSDKPENGAQLKFDPQAQKDLEAKQAKAMENSPPASP